MRPSFAVTLELGKGSEGQGRSRIRSDLTHTLTPAPRTGPVRFWQGSFITRPYRSSLPSSKAAASNGYSTVLSGDATFAQTSAGARVCSR